MLCEKELPQFFVFGQFLAQQIEKKKMHNRVVIK